MIEGRGENAYTHHSFSLIPSGRITYMCARVPCLIFLRDTPPPTLHPYRMPPARQSAVYTSNPGGWCRRAWWRGGGKGIFAMARQPRRAGYTYVYRYYIILYTYTRKPPGVSLCRRFFGGVRMPFRACTERSE